MARATTRITTPKIQRIVHYAAAALPMTAPPADSPADG